LAQDESSQKKIRRDEKREKLLLGANSGVIQGSFELYVKEGESLCIWKRAAQSFIEVSKATVRGVNGKREVAGNQSGVLTDRGPK